MTTSESPISEGDEEHAVGRKKSVSFSEQVDRTSYKANSTVSALHSTLQNRRKKARKREEKKNKSKGDRRRRTSSGGSYSSDDLSSTGKPEEVDVDEDDLGPHSKVIEKRTGDGRQQVETKAKSDHSPPETRAPNKEVVAKKRTTTENTDVLEGKDIRENGEDLKRDKCITTSEPRGAEQNPSQYSIINSDESSANEINIYREAPRSRRPEAQ